MAIKSFPIQNKNKTISSNRLFKYASQLNIDDLEGIIGIEAACKFLKIFAGVSLRFPEFKSIQTAFRNTMIRYEYKHLKQLQSTKRRDIYGILLDKYKLSGRHAVYDIIFNYGSHDKIKRDVIKSREKRLLQLLGKYSEILKTYGFI